MMQLTTIENEIRDVKAIIRERNVPDKESEGNLIIFVDFTEKYKLSMPFNALEDFQDFDDRLRSDKDFRLEFVSTFVNKFK